MEKHNKGKKGISYLQEKLPQFKENKSGRRTKDMAAKGNMIKKSRLQILLATEKGIERDIRLRKITLKGKGARVNILRI